MKPLASIRTSKGCPHRCNFCALWKVAGGHYLKRSPECIVEELAQIEEPYVFFADDESLVDAARMETQAHRIREAGIEKQYFLYGRSDTIARNPGLLELWASGKPNERPHTVYDPGPGRHKPPCRTPSPAALAARLAPGLAGLFGQGVEVEDKLPGR